MVRSARRPSDAFNGPLKALDGTLKALNEAFGASNATLKASGKAPGNQPFWHLPGRSASHRKGIAVTGRCLRRATAEVRPRTLDAFRLRIGDRHETKRGSQQAQAQRGEGDTADAAEHERPPFKRCRAIPGSGTTTSIGPDRPGRVRPQSLDARQDHGGQGRSGNERGDRHVRSGVCRADTIEQP